MSNTQPILISDLTSPINEIQIIKEEGSIEKNNLRVYFETILQTFEKKNRNKRIYTDKCGKNIYEQALKLIEDDIFVGELDHPISDKVEREAKVELKSVSHKFTEVRLSNNVLYGKGFTTNTVEGRNLAGLMLDNVKMGFSLRGLGFNTKKTGDIEIVDAPIMLITYDCVCTPSHHDAVVQKISLTEAFDIICDNGLCPTIAKLPPDLMIRYENYIKSKSKDEIIDGLIEKYFR